MERNDFKFEFHDNKYDILTQFDIETELTFRKRKKVINNDDEDKNKNSISFINSYIEIKNDKKLNRIINHTEIQLKDVIDEYNLNLTVIAFEVQEEMFKEEECINLKKENEDAYLAMFQVRLWNKILKDRKKIIIKNLKK